MHNGFEIETLYDTARFKKAKNVRPLIQGKKIKCELKLFIRWKDV